MLASQIDQGRKLWLVIPPFLVGLVKNFDGCSLSNFIQIGVECMIKDHFGTIVRVFSKQVGVGLVIKADILVLLEDLL